MENQMETWIIMGNNGVILELYGNTRKDNGNCYIQLRFEGLGLGNVQGDLVSRRETPITHLVTVAVPTINLFIKSQQPQESSSGHFPHIGLT